MNEIAIYNKMEKIRSFIQTEFRKCFVYATIKFIEDAEFKKLDPIIYVSVYDVKTQKFYDSYYSTNIELNEEVKVHIIESLKERMDESDENE